MMGLAAGTRIWIVAGVTDMRRGFVGLSGMVQTALEENPFSGQVFVFRGRRGDLIKVLWWDGDGLCLFAKRLERGRFVWPQATGGVCAIGNYGYDWSLSIPNPKDRRHAKPKVLYTDDLSSTNAPLTPTPISISTTTRSTLTSSTSTKTIMSVTSFGFSMPSPFSMSYAPRANWVCRLLPFGVLAEKIHPCGASGIIPAI